ncbi:phage major capsid protein [Rheinheimera maricola]|uniref:Bacteriophage Mu GpT domain-containing protein n=1 Tax=Rheinheimera maricola TaxID=2793282 RepID=A0ABS7X9C1_9GAMM|nr:hypothetical protein [Rheinheimera maricola]MBZ9612146.1 hypothetical protein [Rheinheimera maricola]
MTIRVLQRQQGILGNVALREAKAGELGDIIMMVREALAKHLSKEWVDLVSIFANKAVVAQGGRFISYSYELAEDNGITISNPVEVVRDFVPAGVTQLTEAWGSDSIFIESVDKAAGSKFLITVIEAGISYNNTNYPAAVLREATPLFNGARVFVKSDDEHLKGQGKSFNNLIGQLTKPRFVEAAGGKKLGAIQATLELLKTAGDVSDKMVEAVERGMTELFGFSIDCDGTAKQAGKLREAKQIQRVNSVDLIIEPGAGGRVIRMVEAKQPQEDINMTLLQRMLEAITRQNPALLKGLDQENEDAVLAAYREAVAVKPESGDGISKDELNQALKMVEARAYAKTAITASKLPAPAQERLQAQFSGQANFTEAAVDEAITAERTYLGKFTESGKPMMPEGGPRYGDAPNAAQLLAAFFDPKDRAVQSFKECYIEITGDKLVTGRLDKCSRSRMVEALDSSNLGNVLGEAMHKRMIEEYNQPDQYEIWREVAKVTPVSDFRNQERVRYGGYGDLPVVGESGNYNPLTSPTDEKAQFAVSKRGGTESVTLEMVKNDDVGVILDIPRKMSRAAKRTLSKFVLDFLRTNPAIYDTKAFFHVDHANLLTTALSTASWAAARLAMIKQTEFGAAGEQLGIAPRLLMVPADLEEAAYDLFRRDTNNDETFTQSQKPKILVPWYWTDPNDWVAMADKNDIPSIEVGFLDGQEEPEMFVQDNPTVGSLFTNDTITYKIRHIYGGVVKDFRGAVKSVVA